LVVRKKWAEAPRGDDELRDLSAMCADDAYNELLRRAQEEALLASCAELLGWDEETYMPHGGAEHRGEQLALLAGLSHDRAVDSAVGELLAALEGSDLVADPLAPPAVNVRQWRRLYDRERRLPRALVAEFAQVTTLAQQAWVDARREVDFGLFQPWLERVVRLEREQAEALGTANLYDALLEEYEPGCTAAAVADLLAELRRELLPLLHAILGSRRPAASLHNRAYPIEEQKTFAAAAAAALGFDLQRGRIDVAAHPFSTRLGPEDCRLTARYYVHDFGEGFYTVLHEAGHGLYEQGLDGRHFGTPMGEAASLGMHEAQARLYENLVGRRRSFWEYFFPLAVRSFSVALDGVSLDEFQLAQNSVQPSPIRVRADEVTYNLHILIRFELEQALLRGDLATGDLPAAWAEAYRHTLGIMPADDLEGCLQDGHWASGMIGYFPTYTLGNVFAAQLMERAEQEAGPFDRAFAGGDFRCLLAWLRERVHVHGQRWSAAELVERATGSPPRTTSLVRSLATRYGELHGL
jgi:carboxypeptidase Taq